MVIDFHTHAFPDELAKKAVPGMFSQVNYYVSEIYSDGTLGGLLSNMDKWGVDISVVQPVVTRQSQTEAANLWAQSIMSQRIISFGSISPDTDDYKRDIDFVVSLGLKGLKFHPEYQNFTVDDLRLLRIYDYAISRGLMLLFHAGLDPSFPAPYKSSPRQFAAVADAMGGGVIIAAHLGGHGQWYEVANYFEGRNIYIDTSMGSDYYTQEQFLSIANRLGADRLLFASDSPWGSAEREIRAIKSLPLDEKSKELILSDNAWRLLGL